MNLGSTLEYAESVLSAAIEAIEALQVSTCPAPSAQTSSSLRAFCRTFSESERYATPPNVSSHGAYARR